MVWSFRFGSSLLSFILLVSVMTGCGVADTGQSVITVSAVVETQPVPNTGDAADDPVIWVNPTHPELSVVIGTDKKGGLGVYDLGGRLIQYVEIGNVNNVDLRNNFNLNNVPITLVTAGERRRDTLEIYRLNPATRKLENIAARAIETVGVYGSCMYHSRISGKFYYIVTSEKGEVEQWELFATPQGKVDATRVRAFTVGSQTEGCVADDELGHLYLAEEDVGIWKYGAEPNAGTTRTQIDAVGSKGNLTADVEGLAIYKTGNTTGYLIASNQGDNSYVIYDRAGNNRYIATFKIGASATIDAVTETDGLDVTSANLGPNFPRGMLVVQDGNNRPCNQNFKYVPWHTIAAAVGLPASTNAQLPLPVDTSNSEPVPAATSVPTPIPAECNVVQAPGGPVFMPMLLR
jgi:3-phytase